MLFVTVKIKKNTIKKNQIQNEVNQSTYFSPKTKAALTPTFLQEKMKNLKYDKGISAKRQAGFQSSLNGEKEKKLKHTLDSFLTKDIQANIDSFVAAHSEHVEEIREDYQKIKDSAKDERDLFNQTYNFAKQISNLNPEESKHLDQGIHYTIEKHKIFKDKSQEIMNLLNPDFYIQGLSSDNYESSNKKRDRYRAINDLSDNINSNSYQIIDFTKNNKKILESLLGDFESAFIYKTEIKPKRYESNFVIAPETNPLTQKDIELLANAGYQLKNKIISMNYKNPDVESPEERAEALKNNEQIDRAKYQILELVGNGVDKLLNSKGFQFKKRINIYNKDKTVGSINKAYMAKAANADAEFRNLYSFEVAKKILNIDYENTPKDRVYNEIYNSLISFAKGPVVSRKTIIDNYDAKNTETLDELIPLLDRKTLTKLQDNWSSHSYIDSNDSEVKAASSTEGLVSNIAQALKHKYKIENYEVDKDSQAAIVAKDKRLLDMYKDSSEVKSAVIDFIIDNHEKYGLDDSYVTVQEIADRLKPNGRAERNFYNRLKLLDEELPREYANDIFKKYGLRNLDNILNEVNSGTTFSPKYSKL